MLFRSKPPNQHHWNGLGGKLLVNETPLEGVQREVIEEAGIDLRMAGQLYFAGVVTWSLCADPTDPGRGMYAYIAEISSAEQTWEREMTTSEGLLCWKPVQWVCDLQNTAVVSNIPHFLPNMLSQRNPQEYFCDYHEGRLVAVNKRPLSQEFLL